MCFSQSFSCDLAILVATITAHKSPKKLFGSDQGSSDAREAIQDNVVGFCESFHEEDHLLNSFGAWVSCFPMDKHLSINCNNHVVRVFNRLPLSGLNDPNIGEIV